METLHQTLTGLRNILATKGYKTAEDFFEEYLNIDIEEGLVVANCKNCYPILWETIGKPGKFLREHNPAWFHHTLKRFLEENTHEFSVINGKYYFQEDAEEIVETSQGLVESILSIADIVSTRCDASTVVDCLLRKVYTLIPDLKERIGQS